MFLKSFFIMTRYVLVLLFFSIGKHTTTQNIEPFNNNFQIFYSPSITKTNFDKSIENAHFGFKELYETAKPSLPIIGYSFGLLYARKISKRSKINFSLKRNVYGQSSPVAYNFRGFVPVDTIPGYGGLKYKVLMWSNSLSVGYRKVFLFKKSLQFEFGGSTGIDVYEKGMLQDYIVERKTGITTLGCCTGYYYKFSTFQKLHDFLYPFKKGFYRVEFAIVASARVNLSKRFFFAINPEFRYLTNLVGASPDLESLIPHGDIFSAGLGINVGTSF